MTFLIEIAVKVRNMLKITKMTKNSRK